MNREEATHHESTPNEIPSWELCKYFHPLPQPADRLIPLSYLINHRGVERGADGRNWVSGHTTVVGNCPHQHHVCDSILSCDHIHIWTCVHMQVKIARCIYSTILVARLCQLPVFSAMQFNGISFMAINFSFLRWQCYSVASNFLSTTYCVSAAVSSMLYRAKVIN